MSVSQLIRDARRSARLTQTQLAARMGTTQPAIARLESPGANPRASTIERALAACGRRLTAEPATPELDETLLAHALTLSPAERIRRAVTLTTFANRFAGAASPEPADAGSR